MRRRRREHVARRRDEGGDETVEEATTARPVGALLPGKPPSRHRREALADYLENLADYLEKNDASCRETLKFSRQIPDNYL